MAGSQLLTAHDYIVRLDYGQFWLSSCLCPEEDYPLDDLPELAMDELSDLLQMAGEGIGIAQIPVEYSFSGTILVLSPHQANFEMPRRQLAHPPVAFHWRASTETPQRVARSRQVS